ncbi:transposon Tf2-6 polyprotein [Nephila pilipes]|uniref:Transposon Tf2-6 polyprotein n=1 Tax=Nephila pilipes TaxID=299642 RepID=A0A8X6P897_NEPPI|nr:transposon Tf2-6 polyprotein [Nephila pilipes]
MYETVFEPEVPTPFMEHLISTRDSTPVFVPPNRLPPAQKVLLKKELNKLLEQNVIKECESQHAAPVVLVPKAKEKIHFCIDYRSLKE